MFRIKPVIMVSNILTTIINVSSGCTLEWHISQSMLVRVTSLSSPTTLLELGTNRTTIKLLHVVRLLH